MAEEESELELDRFKKELESLLNDECGRQSKLYCTRFCEVRQFCEGNLHTHIERELSYLLMLKP